MYAKVTKSGNGYKGMFIPPIRGQRAIMGSKRHSDKEGALSDAIEIELQFYKAHPELLPRGFTLFKGDDLYSFACSEFRWTSKSLEELIKRRQSLIEELTTITPTYSRKRLEENKRDNG